MSELARKPDLLEQIGIAVNTSALTFAQDGHERALDRVAALGAASLAVHLGADLENVPIAGARSIVYGDALDPRDVIAGRLVPMLLHIRYGGQLGAIPAAVDLFADWIAYRALFSQWAAEEQRPVRVAFSARSIHEWLSDMCTSCGGSGKHERTQGGQWVRPRGSMQRNATFRACDACNGSRRAPVRHSERVKAMGITRQQYDDERWAQRFNSSLQWLNQLLPNRITRSLTAELERRKRRG